VLLCLSASHRTASLEALERLTRVGPRAIGELVRARSFIEGAVVLATCNRFEVYLDIDDPVTAERTVAAETVLLALTEADPANAELRDAVTVLSGQEEVARHLFAVSSGLESVVQGEDEIAGQVRRALEDARRAGVASGPIDQLFQAATRTSRAVKAKADVGGAGRSLVRLALDLAQSRVTDWAQAEVLLVGTGQYAATTVAALRERGARRLSVYSRSGRAMSFAARHGLVARTSLAEAVRDAEVVLTCTTDLAVRPADVPDGRRRLFVDLGLPRNVSPEVGGLPGVELLDLETIRLHAPLVQLQASDTARAMVGRAAASFSAASQVEDAVVALRRHVFDLLDAELERAERRGEPSGTAEALRHLAGVLLHGPSVRARELADEGHARRFVEGVEAVFGVRAEPAAGRASEAGRDGGAARPSVA